MNPTSNFAVNKWWLQADSGHRERLNSEAANANFSPSSTPVIPKGLAKKPDCLGLEGKGQCQAVAEIGGDWSFDERDGRLRWYLAEEKVLALMIAEKHAEPLRNCDLPTPHHRGSLKNSVMGEHHKPPLPTKSVSSDLSTPLLQSIGCKTTQTKEEYMNEHPDKKQDLLKALQLSQTRARVAERKASITSMENDSLLNLYFKDSARLFAYRQWVKLLELEIWQLQSQAAFSQSSDSWNYSENPTKSGVDDEKNRINEDSNRAWYWAVALSLSLVSVGIVLTWRRGWRLSGLRGDDLPRFGMGTSFIQLVRSEF